MEPKRPADLVVWVLLLAVAIAGGTARVGAQDSVPFLADEWTFGGENADRANAQIVASDGTLVAAGLTYTSDADHAADVYLIRTRPDGSLIWELAFGGPSFDEGASVVEAPDGTFVVAGVTDPGGPCPPSCEPEPSDLYLASVHPDGRVLWERTFGGSASDAASDLVCARDGGFVAAGSTRSSGSGQSDVYVVRTDALGMSLWERAVGGEGNDVAHAVCEAPGGGFVVVGETSSLSDSRDVYLVHVDAHGDTVWERAIGGPDAEQGVDLQPAEDGGWVLAARLFRGPEDGGIYLVAVDRDGRPRWEELVRDPAGPVRNFPAALVEAPGGGWIIAGHTDTSTTAADAFLLGVDPRGRRVWEKAFGNVDQFDVLRAIALSSDGELRVAGSTGAVKSRSLSDDSDVYLARLSRREIADGVFVRGDANDDGELNLPDAVFTLAHLFLGGPPPDCWDSADSNDDGAITLSDPIYLLNRLFADGRPLPPPYPAPGEDPTADGLDCAR